MVTERKCFPLRGSLYFRCKHRLTFAILGAEMGRPRASFSSSIMGPHDEEDLRVARAQVCLI